jgi:hypothetical protein
MSFPYSWAVPEPESRARVEGWKDIFLEIPYGVLVLGFGDILRDVKERYYLIHKSLILIS